MNLLFLFAQSYPQAVFGGESELVTDVTSLRIQW